MTSDAFIPFFAAAAGAGAAFIGLLFVAISIRPDQLVGSTAHPLVRASVGSAFTALINGFFIACGSLIPSTNAGWLTLAFASLGIINTVTAGGGFARHLRRPSTPRRALWVTLLRWLSLLGVSLVIYGYEFSFGLQAVKQPGNISPTFSIAAMVLTVYGLGLARAWELLGARRTGLLSFLSPLHDLEDLAEKPAQ